MTDFTAWIDGEALMELVKWVGGFALTTLVIVWQVSKQFKLNRELKKNEIRDKLFLEIYRELDELTRDVQSKKIEASDYALDISVNIKSLQSGYVQSANDNVCRMRSNYFFDRHQAFSSAAVELILKMESMEIIHPNLFIFRLALGSALHDLSEAFHPTFQAFWEYLPSDPPPNTVGETLFPSLPNNERLVLICSQAEIYYEACAEIGSYLHDHGIEMQNLLLGSLFEGNQVPKRTPLDPSSKVISITPDTYVEELKTYFETETAWGKRIQELEKETRSKFQI